MQTFLPYPDFVESARVLDNKRLAGQRKEAVQLLHALQPGILVGTPELLDRKNAALARGEIPKRGWSNHAAAKMWAGRVPALVAYLWEVNNEWLRRGYKSTLVFGETSEAVVMPSWIGREDFHASHRSNLLRKLPEHYEQFGWTEGPDLEYVWPGPCTLRLPGDIMP